ncbi:MAG: sulfatase-like hydrolase/transferase [Polyangiaceae bacterium]
MAAAAASLSLISAAPLDLADSPPIRKYEPRAAHVVIVVLDGVRHDELSRGTDSSLWGDVPRPARELVPHLWALADRGVFVGEMEASGPNFVSLPGYTEILTGHASQCQANDCEHPVDLSLVDVVCGENEGCESAIVGSWPSLARLDSGRSDAVVSAGQTAGRALARLRADPELGALWESGSRAGSNPGGEGYRPDQATIALAEAYLERVSPEVMLVSLGDMDEYAHAGDYAAYVSALERADAFLASVDRWALDRDAHGEPTTVFVTADHGRSIDFRDHGKDHPESQRVWLVAAGAGIAQSGAPHVDARAVPRLRDLGPTAARLLGYELPPHPLRGRVLSEILAPAP